MVPKATYQKFPKIEVQEMVKFCEKQNGGQFFRVKLKITFSPEHFKAN
jgi:hypothetical protein